MKKITDDYKTVFAIWKYTYMRYDEYISACEKEINDKYIKKIDVEDISLREKSEKLRRNYYDIIKDYLICYNKQEFLMGLIAVKDFITKMLTIEPTLPYINDERNSINMLISYVLSIDTSNFNNHPLYCYDKKLANIFNLMRQLYLLECNLERYAIAEKNKITLKDMAFSTVEDDELNNFYEEWSKQGIGEKFEDYQINDINVQKQIERLKVGPDFIRKDSNKVLKDKFGFDLDTLLSLNELVMDYCFKTRAGVDCYLHNEKIGICYYMPRTIIESKCEQKGISNGEVDAVLQVFSFENKNEQDIELSCFYLLDDCVYFGIIDMIQVFDIFEKFSLSGHFLQHYINDINFITLLHPSQKKLSTYMCYVLVDILIKHNYKFHIEKFKYEGKTYLLPCAEIKNIKVGNKNILKDLGDVDILFLDEYKKQIVCVEYKYFQPADSYDKMYSTDCNKFKKQICEKNKQIQGRENVIRENVDYVVKFLGGAAEKYTVKTIIVLARPNMYVYTKEGKENINYEVMTMIDFNKRASEHNL